MRKILIGLVLMAVMLIQACGCSKQPTRNDIIGSWKCSDGATLDFNKDGTFTGKSLPARFFTFYTSDEQVMGKKINGSGWWKIEKGQGFKEIKLHFQKINDDNTNGFYSVLISGEKGILENKPLWYLFLWQEEEGGERYKFLRQ